MSNWMTRWWGRFSGMPLPEIGEDSVSRMRLGRKAIKTDSRTVKLANYLTPALPPAPPSCDWTKGITDFGVMLNDRLGCCTIAGCGHAIQIWSANTGKEVTLLDSTILQYYEYWDGYDPSDPSTDQGGVELDVLRLWRKQGIAGRKILGFAQAAQTNLDELRQAINLFGGLYIGMQVPNFIMEAIPDLWDVVPDDGGIDGGHCVYLTGYDAQTFSFISWGKVYKMTIPYFQKYVDEAWSILGQDWLTANGAPNGFNLAQLTADLSAIH